MRGFIRSGVCAPWIISAIGLALIALASFTFASSKGHQAANQQHETENAGHAEREGQYSRCLVLPTIQEARECYKNTAETSRSEERSEQDLNAQREMADWAEGMLWATLATVLVTSIGVVYVALTLREARRTTIAAIRSTVHARASVAQAIKANEAVTSIGNKQLRAYLYIAKARLRFVEPPFRPQIEIKFKNFGQTPAHRVRHKMTSIIDMGIFRQSGGSKDSALTYDLGPSQDMRTSVSVDLDLIRGMEALIEKGAAFLLVEGTITYDDAFGNKDFVTRYKLRHHVDPEYGLRDSDVFVVCEDGNNST